jgi:predicted nucleotidyltransferase
MHKKQLLTELKTFKVSQQKKYGITTLGVFG